MYLEISGAAFVRQSRGPSLRYGALPSSLPLLAIFLSLSGGQSGLGLNTGETKLQLPTPS
jgi:hypothetical protein